ncbi:HEAT repeat protein [Botrimarina hoheduenensis]|uniref:HEAT repeat protein n=2 Tax=Botrimarina hoheduenensis TaxID=2528000 RepID=A0A5C5W020_9BACT|nr:HEAT repeat protein [Botrimarina hoheduenensis]
MLPKALLTTLILSTATGCQSGGPRMAGLNPFYRPELTSITTPAERVKELRALAEGAPSMDTGASEKMVVDLVRQLGSEPNPMIRQAIIETTTQFKTPLAAKTPIAGLQDEDSHVRQACCRMLAERPTPAGAAALAAVAKQDADFDVRIAAVQALGEQKDPIAQQALLAALEDSDPAMQLVGVQSMRRVSGKDLGGNVADYIALARKQSAPTTAAGSGEPAIEVAERTFGWLPK